MDNEILGWLRRVWGSPFDVVYGIYYGYPLCCIAHYVLDNFLNLASANERGGAKMPWKPEESYVPCVLCKRRRLRRYMSSSVLTTERSPVDKRAYYLELPDKDFALLLMDDGEKQEILTTSANWPEVWMDMLREKGFEPLGFRRTWRSATDPDGTLKNYSAWHRTDGKVVHVGYLSGIGPLGPDREAGKEADYPPTP